MAKENKNEIIWVLCNKKTFESELHQMSFHDTEEGKDLYWEQIQYLTTIHTQRGKTVKAEFKPNNVCVLTIWS